MREDKPQSSQVNLELQARFVRVQLSFTVLPPNLEFTTDGHGPARRLQYDRFEDSNLKVLLWRGVEEEWGEGGEV